MRDVTVVEDVWGEPFDDLATRWSVVREPDAWSDAERLRQVAAGSTAIVVRNRTPVTRSLFAAAPGLRLVARAGVGLDNIDVSAADEHGVVVCAALGANAVSVAEHAIGLALAVARRLTHLDGEVRQGAWTRAPGRELAGGTWGLLSAGATARATATLAQGLGMRVIAYDPFLEPDDGQLRRAGISLCSLEATVAQADVLSVHLPATETTRHLVDSRLLALMKPDAILVNVGRGETVDEEALADCLESGHLHGAGLDVRDHEPPPPDSRLHRLPNVVLSPHVAGITAQAQHRIAALLCSEIDTVLSGGKAEHAVGTLRAPSAVVR